MNFAEALRALLRRWYITFPGLVLAVAVAFGAWSVIPPDYERSATQLLLPGADSMPADSNPFLFLGGLSYAADVLVRAIGAENVMGEIAKEHPDAKVEVTRDVSSSGPFVLITVTAPDDAEAGKILDGLVVKTGELLNEMQDAEKIEQQNRITVTVITVDAEGTAQQRDRLVASAGAGIGVAALTLILAALIDGLVRQRRRRAKGVPDDADLQMSGDEAFAGFVLDADDVATGAIDISAVLTVDSEGGSTEPDTGPKSAVSAASADQDAVETLSDGIEDGKAEGAPKRRTRPSVRSVRDPAPGVTTRDRTRQPE